MSGASPKGCEGAVALAALWLQNPELTTNRSRRVVIDFTVARDGRLTVVRRVQPHRVTPALPQSITTVLAQVPD